MLVPVHRLHHWWSLLLPAVYRITEIAITIKLPGEQRCATIPSIAAGGRRSFVCNGMIGRLINVKLESTDTGSVLTMCELEAYGELAAPSPSFSAVVSGRGVEVVEKKLCCSDALFYCRDFYWDLLSIRSEEEQREVEGVLRNVSFPLTEHVWLGLRRYLKADTWFWMPGATESYNNFETKPSWWSSSRCGAMNTSNEYSWWDRPCEEHLHFICLRDIQPNKKRVEFYSSARP
ncbi:uncharacterized protein LOC117807966 isoform X2 [Xyrichtys novacula]|uniref:Uncharacterized protein LOC117807966 isoform X2 n=1 Tax=Xyrichtys novacula TaxID=13765 RepID=A0AAV1HNI6_XYRNO|nr:uncharacterized protein LOC117807966 isoform X2 [Xyrichtys novacula]